MSIGLLTVTVINICVTWFLVNKSDKKKAAEVAVGTDEENTGVGSSDEVVVSKDQ